jgi:multisubunit Na+/H+ antiporter MnhB subunit
VEEAKQQNIITGLKYIYLLFFFGFLSGLFYPIVTGYAPDKALTGILILWIGLIGILLLYKAAKEEEKRLKYLIMGTIVVISDMFFIIAATGRFG